MIDSSSNPTQLEDTQVEVNPYEIGSKIWSLIEKHFREKYDVQITESFPLEKVTRPTIVSLVYKRTPGREGSKIHGKGHNFVKFLKKTPDGYIHEVHMQQQEILLEYSVFTTTTAEVNRIAWDLERAVLETVGILQNEIEGFQLVFDQQTIDSSLLWRGQDELVRRTIRFKILLPVKFIKVVPELRYIDIIESWGTTQVEGAEVTRTSSENTYYIPVDDGQRVSNIRVVYVKDTEYPFQWIALLKDTDFFIKRTKDQTFFIEWNDKYGKVPAVGETFRVDYDLTQFVRTTTLKP